MACVVVWQGLVAGSIVEKCALPPVSEEALKEREIREGSTVPLTTHLPCNVSFVRGQERSVHFAVVGLPTVCQNLLDYPLL